MQLNDERGAQYRNLSQRARYVSEAWVAQFGFCLACDSDKLNQTPANAEACDFVCGKCDHRYELKSKRGHFGRSVVDGSYRSMVDAIRSNRTPTLLLLEYAASWNVCALDAIHSSLITEKTIKQRKPLAQTARRAGWQGCAILLSEIAADGTIPIWRNGVVLPRAEIRGAFQRFEGLAALPHVRRGWAGAVLKLLAELPDRDFDLADIYKHESKLKLRFPENHNIRAKIRQQLQVLRDAGLVNFLGRGRYRLNRFRTSPMDV